MSHAPVVPERNGRNVMAALWPFPKLCPADLSSFLDYVQSQPSPGALRIGDLLHDLNDLTTELQDYDPEKVIAASAALASLAENHTLVYRINAR